MRQRGALVELLIAKNKGPVLAQVDCQHRLGHLQTLDISLPFLVFVGLSEDEELELFSVINGKAKGLSSSLLDFHESRLSADLARERPELFVALQLNDRVNSPWFKQLDLGGDVTSGMRRRASLRTMQKAVKRFLTAAGILADETPQTIATVVEEYWAAVASVLAPAWAKPRNHFLTKGIGVYALMGILADLWAELRDSGLPPRRTNFASLLSDFATEFDWSTTGPLRGLGGESGAKEALTLLRSARTRARAHLVGAGNG
jgi:DGQHR domain-containing protein